MGVVLLLGLFVWGLFLWACGGVDVMDVVVFVVVVVLLLLLKVL